MMRGLRRALIVMSARTIKVEGVGVEGCAGYDGGNQRSKEGELGGIGRAGAE